MIVWKLISDLAPTTTLSIRLLSRSTYNVLQTDIVPDKLSRLFDKGKKTCAFVERQVNKRDVNMLIRIVTNFIYGFKAADSFAKASMLLVDPDVWFSASQECWPVFCWIYNTSPFPRWWEDGEKRHMDVNPIYGTVIYKFYAEDSTALLRLDKFKHIALSQYTEDDTELTKDQKDCIIDMLYEGRLGSRSMQVLERLIDETNIFVYENIPEEYEQKVAETVRRIDANTYREIISWYSGSSLSPEWLAFLEKHNITL